MIKNILLAILTTILTYLFNGTQMEWCILFFIFVTYTDQK